MRAEERIAEVVRAEECPVMAVRAEELICRCSESWEVSVGVVGADTDPSKVVLGGSFDFSVHHIEDDMSVMHVQEFTLAEKTKSKASLSF